MSLSFASAVPVAGLLHILSNATKDIFQAAGHMHEVYPGLDALARFLHARPTRELLLNTCCAQTPGLRYRGWLEKPFPHVFVGWRWEAALRCCRSLVDIWPVLKEVWDPRKMAPGGRGVPASAAASTDVVGAQDSESQRA